MLFLKLFTRFFAELGSIGGAIQNHKEVLGELGIRLGLGLHESRVRNREQQAEQKYTAEDNSSSYAKNQDTPTSFAGRFETELDWLAYFRIVPHRIRI